MHAGLASYYFCDASSPRDGGQIISVKLAYAIELFGRTVHLRRGIHKIQVENGVAVGVVTEPKERGEQVVRAKRVLSNADIQRPLESMVGVEHLPKRWIKKIENFPRPIPAKSSGVQRPYSRSIFLRRLCHRRPWRLGLNGQWSPFRPSHCQKPWETTPELDGLGNNGVQDCRKVAQTLVRF